VQTVIETIAFLAQAKAAGMTENERSGAVSLIAHDPMAGDVMRGTGGCRKIRFAKDGQGKSGSYRLIWWFDGEDIPVFMKEVFAKGQKANLDAAERAKVKTLTTTLRDSLRSKK